jgi:hypothetical protein
MPGCSRFLQLLRDRVYHLADLIKLSCNAMIPFNIEMVIFQLKKKILENET